MSRVHWIAAAIAIPVLALAQPHQRAATGVPAEVVVTVGHYYSAVAPSLNRKDLVITQGTLSDPLPIVSLTPLRGDIAPLELFLLVDNCSNCEPGSKMTELRQFIVSQSPETAIGVAYIQNGLIHVAVNPTFDHEAAFGALSAPSGSAPADPFRALSELIAKWQPLPKPQASPDVARRAVLMISNGFDPNAKAGQRDPSVERAIRTAQHAEVTVYAIYHPAADYATADVANLYSGQVQLAHLANETGGEAYFMNFGPLPSLEPLLVDMTHHLANQYLVKFMARPNANSTGGYEAITVKTTTPGVRLMAPDRVFVPAVFHSPSIDLFER